MKLKICGIKDLQTLKACDDAGVDYVGLVFAQSKRRISLEEAMELKAKITLAHSKTVAVFKAMSAEAIQSIIDVLEPDMIQLHDPVAVSYPSERVIHVISYPSPLNRTSGHLLVDSPVAGSGKAFDWSHLSTASTGVKLWVAGGLHIGNLPDLLSGFTPYAIDISSGAETNGVKDIQKIKALANYMKEVHHGIRLS